MKLIMAVVSLLLAAGRLADAQTADEVQISVGGFELAANGAEKEAGVRRSTGPLIIGKPTVGVFSIHGCGYFTVTAPPDGFDKNATVGWRVEVTPKRVVNHAVTFRLRWARALDKGSGLTPVSEDMEVTLRPGESRPLDSVPVVQTGVTTYDGRPCETKVVSLRVVVDFPNLDRRLISVDVWLVERLSNGKEESQMQYLRGLPHRPISFYFDGVFDGTARLDIFGKLVGDPQQGSIDIALETIRGEAHPGQPGYQSARWFRSTLRMKPDEIVEVALPSDEKTAAFAKRVFSIRIRAKQIR
jgi:hypothetical protein